MYIITFKGEAMQKQIETNEAPGAIGPYSQGVIFNNLVFSAGMLPLDPKNGTIVSGGIKEQAKQALINLKAVLEAGQSGLDKIIKTTCFLSNMDDFAAFNEVYSAYITGKPARSCVAVKTLPKNALVEIEAIASQ
jgi:2-iminobutanoate/2-iminopropanoate deaminase